MNAVLFSYLLQHFTYLSLIHRCFQHQILTVLTDDDDLPKNIEGKEKLL